MKLIDLIHYCHQFLQVDNFRDYAPNGLQVEGSKKNIKRVAFAVSADLETIERSAAWKADALIVHHGLIWKGQMRTLTGAFGERFSVLLKNDINLIAYHLPLDAHLEVGNAAALATQWGIKKFLPLCDSSKMPLGVYGEFTSPILLGSAIKKLESILKHPVMINGDWDHKRRKIQRVGIITGGASSYWKQALDLNLEVFLSGEMKEYDWFEAKEEGIITLAGGHHATEQFGVQFLQRHLQKKFKNLSTQFFSSANLA